MPSPQNLHTPTDHIAWDLMHQRQILVLQGAAYSHFDLAMYKLGYGRNRIPSFDQVNNCLNELTGWKIDPVPGQISFRERFWRMATRQLSGKDDFAQVIFGYFPLLADPAIANYLLRLGLIAIRCMDDKVVMEQLDRLYQHTVEFGLVMEKRQIRIYGARILSSIPETEYCLSPAANHLPFQLERVLQTPYYRDKFQEQYFVLTDIGQLQEAANELDKRFPGMLN